MNRSNNFAGPWDVPLRQFNNHFLIKVTVYKVHENKEDETVSEHVIDYGNYEDRKFLGRISFWAYSQDYVVETMPVRKD